MERPLKGDIVVINFPFSDFTFSKRRPALVVTSLKGNDSILCQITGKITDSYTIPLNESDFLNGSLKKQSNVRPNKLFTAENSTILYKAGKIKKQKTEEIIEKIYSILKE